jgi:hypothetical protein
VGRWGLGPTSNRRAVAGEPRSQGPRSIVFQSLCWQLPGLPPASCRLPAGFLPASRRLPPLVPTWSCHRSRSIKKSRCFPPLPPPLPPPPLPPPPPCRSEGVLDPLSPPLTAPLLPPMPLIEMYRSASDSTTERRRSASSASMLCGPGGGGGGRCADRSHHGLAADRVHGAVSATLHGAASAAHNPLVRCYCTWLRSAHH